MLYDSSSRVGIRLLYSRTLRIAKSAFFMLDTLVMCNNNKGGGEREQNFSYTDKIYFAENEAEAHVAALNELYRRAREKIKEAAPPSPFCTPYSRSSLTRDSYLIS